jgi:hypothetical protein
MRRSVAVTVEMDGTELLGDLVERLATVGCMVLTIDDRSCRIVHPGATDPAEEWSEIRFFLRAWESSRGVRVKVRPGRVPAPRVEDYGPAARSSGFSIRPCS